MKPFLSSLIGPLKSTRRDDPIFGRMLYMGDRLKYWEAKTIFDPISSEIEVFVTGSCGSSMEKQHKFFRQLAHDWPSVRDRIGVMLLSAFAEDPRIRKDSLWKELKVSSVSVPDGLIDNADWEISLVRTSEPDHLYTVEMKGEAPQRVVIDD
jgi:hypothetical protein